MPTRRITTLALTTLIAAGSLTGQLAAASASAAVTPARVASSSAAAVRPQVFRVEETGYGATLAAAEKDGQLQISLDYSGCTKPYYLEGDGQFSDGTWWATYEAGCTGED